MSRWPKVALKYLCTEASRYERPVPGTTYRQLGVRLWGGGGYEREGIDGADTKYKHFNCVASGDLILNKIWARNGAVAVTTPEQAGTYVSSEFPTYVLDQDRLDPQWMRIITKWPRFWTACDNRAQGTSGKNRINPRKFLSIEVPLPSLLEQRDIIARQASVTTRVKQIELLLDASERDADHLLALRYRDAVSEASSRLMAEVAPAVRRSAEINESSKYREVGARSFGKGLFLKRDFDGAAATWQKPVWIREGDVVLSNIKAWEGAIAIATRAHDGCIASHRYITCVPDRAVLTAGFLTFYLLSAAGLERIGTASPGTADRNRTLSLTNLAQIQVPTPPIEVQRAFDCLQAKVMALKQKHIKIREANAALIPATLELIFRTDKVGNA